MLARRADRNMFPLVRWALQPSSQRIAPTRTIAGSVVANASIAAAHRPGRLLAPHRRGLLVNLPYNFGPAGRRRGAWRPVRRLLARQLVCSAPARIGGVLAGP